MQLLSPSKIGGQAVANRVVLSPLTRGRCTPTPENVFDIKNSLPNELMQLYYEQRADNNLLISEGTIPSEAGWGWMNAPHISTPEHAAAWSKVTDRVHAKGSIFYCQLWHMGRQTHSSFHPSFPGKIFAPSAVKISNNSTSRTVNGEKVEHEVPTEMTVEDIKRTIDELVNAAQMAKLAGFDGVELHCANGYLLDSFLQSRTNQRTDEYGGSFENRVRIVHELIEAIAAAPDSFPTSRIGIKISPNGVFGDMGSADNDEMFPYFAQSVNKYGLAYIHIMDGLGFGYHEMCRQVTCSDIRKVFDGPILANVGLTRDVAEGLIRSGAADFAVFGRDYMSNPDLVERFKNNYPLTPPPEYQYWYYAVGSKGYNDFLTYAEEQELVEKDEKKEAEE
jgi:N-ethylmaleimide reductase